METTDAPRSAANIDAVVFDAYGTLFDTAAAVERCRAALGERAAALTRLWRAKQLEYSWLRSLRGDYVDFWHVTGESLDHALQASGIDDPVLRGRLMEAYLVVPAFADAKPALLALRAAQLKTAILSNGSPSMLTAAVDHASLARLLDAVLSVDAVGVYKPHPSVYQLACTRFGTTPERIWFVSANPWDVSGAARFGFRTVWLNRAGGLLDPLPGRPERVIAGLDALPGWLGVAG